MANYSCIGCGAYKHVFTGECEDCGCSICSGCCVEARDWAGSSGLCRGCAMKRLNQELAVLVPFCVCSELNASANVPWPDAVRYGQQLTINEAA